MATLLAGESDATRPTTTQLASDGFFSTAKRGGRWWFTGPDGQPFWSLGLNHIDPAALMYEENASIWLETYENDMGRWLDTVRANLIDWGFNSVGWVQEVVTRKPDNHRHSRAFTFEEYQRLDMRYGHLLPFIESHQWEVEHRMPDLHGEGFLDWCDYVARSECTRMRNDSKLLGYFYTDCPCWVHTRPDNAWRGPLFNAEEAETEAGRHRLFELATHYYKTLHDAIRRYDPHHLILGDRYEANAPLPDVVVEAALPYVDVLSFQCFGQGDHVREKLEYWADRFDKPILLADNSVSVKRHDDPADDAMHISPEGYVGVLDALKSLPSVVGYHLCGAYVRNRCRRRGLLTPDNEPDEPTVSGIRAANLAMRAWIEKEIRNHAVR